MNSQEISKLWFKCYGEDLKTEYSGFYNKLTKLEKTINEEELPNVKISKNLLSNLEKI